MTLSAQQLATLARHQYIVKYFNLASGIFLVFDTLENFADEVELIWRQRWSVGKALYLACRYLAFVDLSLMLIYMFNPSLELKTCHRLYMTTTYFTLVGACTAELVLLMRVYAIWGQSLRILSLLCLASLTLFISSILNLSIDNNLGNLVFIPSPAPVILPCYVPRVKIRAFVDFGCLVLMDLIILILTALGGFRYWKESATSPLIVTFYRDGVLYFICLFAVSLANVVLFIVGDPQQQGYLLELQRVLHSVLSARIILNLRKFIVPSAADEGRTDVSTAVFGELISDPYSSTGCSTERSWEEDDCSIRDQNPA